MAYSTSSKYVQLTPYLLMEYMYADQPTPETHFTNTGGSTVTFDKLINGYMDDAVQIFNPPADYSITQNGPENSVVKIAENSFVTLDSNLIIPFNDYSEYLTNTADLPITFPYNLSVVYDTVRYHIRAGYNLQNIDGLIIGIDFQDVDLTYVTISQILLKRGTEQEYILNPNPVTIGSNIYDKFFEIKIPSLKNMNDTYLATPANFQSVSLGGLLSASGRGFVYGAPMRISLWQVQSTDDFAGYNRYNSSRISLLSLEEEDPFANIGAVIQESDKGEFFEYFATDNEGFIEDFILFQNSIGNSYYISHQIEVLEQIGAAIIETSRFETIQTTAYDTPNYYRPIVRNAAYAASFFLRYTMSLVNNKDQTRVIRTATYSSNNPSQWGLNITPIQLSNFPQVQKIYNRVYSQPQIKLGGFNTPQPKEILKFTNVYIQQNTINSTATNLVLQNGSLTETLSSTPSVAVGTGKLTVTLSPFDNYYKFKFIKSGTDGTPVAVDLSNSAIYNLAFLDDQGNKVYVPTLSDQTVARSSSGELAFKVDESVAVRVLKFSDRRFFIVSGGGNPAGATGSTSALSTSLEAVASGNSERLRSVPTSSTDPAINLAVQNYTSLNTITKKTNTLNPDSTKNNPASVIYWGYWKKEGESDFITTVTTTGATGATAAPAPVSSGTQVLGELEPIVVIPRKSIIKSFKPAKPIAGSFGISGSTGVSGTTVNQLTGNALISALSAQIQGYKNSGWTDQIIISYFLTPGNPGYVQYPGLTMKEFTAAAQGILSPVSINSLLQKTPNIRNTGGCPTPDMKIYLGSDNWVTAGNLVKGMEVYTVHEKTGEWGSYKVVHSEIIQQPVLSVKIGGKTVTVSASHKFLTDSGKYEDASSLSIGSMVRTINGISPILEKKYIGESDVVKIEVQGAHTYVMEGFISHNKRAIEKIVE
jgi:hypothetical protein